ncbi:hypothetical protein N665_0383s0039 [Sinapis alba]|nr:hypothetical protein N665_0383s0039 [Sinapis alba]
MKRCKGVEVAEMAATGFGLPKYAFTSLMKQGPHLLAPAGSDLSCYNEEGTIFAGYHYDLSHLQSHSRITTVISHPSAISTMSPSTLSPPCHYRSSPPHLLRSTIVEAGLSSRNP